MSNFIEHRNAGIVTSISIGVGLVSTKSYFNIDVNNTIILIAVITTFMFSLFPDIDVKSIPSKWFYWIIAFVLGYCYCSEQYKIGILVGLFSITPQLAKHRGIFHSQLTAIILPGSVFYLHYINILPLQSTVIIYVAAVVGYFTHLIKDM